ncbi:hypothetical protein BDV96DRAFT_183264 [Lophiotrema nucula]|uniref:Uncharacterized protein n=1 Tax=Lophiotrema nucula TaxID=690887 RepID=A0A6A5YW69_9PLEO|nr:hypothetical protein BDV96DRAFT_183264 [Lophiotrema nucula]
MMSTYSEFRTFKSEVFRSEEGVEKQRGRLLRLSVNHWSHFNDREFAVTFMGQIAQAECLQLENGSLESCRTCRTLRYEFALVVDPSELVKTEESCARCRFLLKQIRSDGMFHQVATIIRFGSNLETITEFALGTQAATDPLSRPQIGAFLVLDGVERECSLPKLSR